MSGPSAHETSSLRVGLVSPYSLSLPGGVQAQVLGLARELRRLGHETRVLGPCDGPPPEPFVTPLGNSLPTAANGSIAPLAPDLSAALRTIRALNDEQFDVVHVHEPFVPGPPMTAVLVRHDPLVATFHAAGRSSSYRIFAPIVERWSTALAAKVVVSKDALALLEDHLDLAAEDGADEYIVLFNGVELDTITAAPPAPTSGPTIFFCGRHEERKGLAVLLGALGDLGEDVHLWVASDGPDTVRLQAAHDGDPRVTWLGRITDAEKFSRLAGASVFCAPSLHGESFGVVLVEAMAANTPVVASALDGYRNVATDGVDALLVEPGDSAALAAALRRVLGDTALADRLRTAGRRRAGDFSMRALAEAYVRIYRDVIARAAAEERAQPPHWWQRLMR